MYKANSHCLTAHENPLVLLLSMNGRIIQQLNAARRAHIETQLRINGFNTYG